MSSPFAFSGLLAVVDSATILCIRRRPATLPASSLDDLASRFGPRFSSRLFGGRSSVTFSSGWQVRCNTATLQHSALQTLHCCFCCRLLISSPPSRCFCPTRRARTWFPVLPTTSRAWVPRSQCFVLNAFAHSLRPLAPLTALPPLAPRLADSDGPERGRELDALHCRRRAGDHGLPGGVEVSRRSRGAG